MDKHKINKLWDALHINSDVIEIHKGLHTYKNGAMSDCFVREFNSCHIVELKETQKGVAFVATATKRNSERLIIGTDSGRKYLRFSITRFDKDPRNRNIEFEYVGDEDMNRYEGVSFSPEFAKKIKKSISDMGF